MLENSVLLVHQMIPFFYNQPVSPSPILSTSLDRDKIALAGIGIIAYSKSGQMDVNLPVLV
jgi:hypothetical protein